VDGARQGATKVPESALGQPKRLARCWHELGPSTSAGEIMPEAPNCAATVRSGGGTATRHESIFWRS
jgi:hypothetical protein